MRRIVIWCLLLSAAMLSGCAMLGGEPRHKSIENRREEPGHGYVIPEALLENSNGIDVGVGLVLPPVVSNRWREDLVDPARPYSFWFPKVGYRGDDDMDCNDPMFESRREKCQEDRRVVTRIVFRAILYRGETSVGWYNALINSRVTESITLLPFGEREKLGSGLNQLLISSDGQFGITTQGKLVDLKEVKDLRQMPPGFFAQHPSPITLATKRLSTSEGRALMVYLREKFPETLTVRGKRYRARPDAKVVWDRYTALDQWPDQILTCTSYSMGPGRMAIGGAFAAMDALRAVIVDDCLK